MKHDAHLRTPAGRPRARSLGIPLAGTPGECDAIADVSRERARELLAERGVTA